MKRKIIFILDEEWKKIKKYPDYVISNFGRIKRIVSAKGTFPGKILKQCKNRYGYLYVFLCKDGIKRNFYIHKLVIEAFIGCCSSGKEINHIDGNKQNPYIENLEYVTRSENCKHAFKLGLRKGKQGIENVNVKLTERDVIKIRKIYKKGIRTQYELAEKFNINVKTIHCIVTRKTWKHI